MKQFKVLVPLFLALLLVVCVAAASDAAVSVTVKNNRSQALSIAFRSSGFDGPDDRRSGWHNVPAGTSKTFTFKEVSHTMTVSDFGYYAKSGKDVWAGKSSDERPLPVIINPKGNFSGHPEDPISGGQKVFFRHATLKETTNPDNGAVTLTFK